MADPENLAEYYQQTLDLYIDEDGFPRPPLVALDYDGKYTMATMALEADQIFKSAIAKFVCDPKFKEVIFGIDRFTKPGQGTKYKDVLTVYWWSAERGWKFGVVNYKPSPEKLIEPIDWDNAFWNRAMQGNITSAAVPIHRLVRKNGENVH